jgi:hypothetical protein
MPNNRTGHTRSESGRPGNLPWQKDQLILDRMQEGAKLRAQGLTGPEIALRQGIDLSVIYDDRKRLLELRKEAGIDATDEHIENLRQQQREAHGDLERTDFRSVNRASLRSLIRQYEIDIAKLDGSYVERKEVKGEIRTVQSLLNTLEGNGPDAP